MPVDLTERRGLQVAVRKGAALPFDLGRRAFQIDADRFSMARDEALTVVRRLLVEHGTVYLQLAWHEGGALAQEYGANTPADPADVRRWLQALGHALGQLHRGGVVHGAVSAERVRRLADGRVLLGLPESARWALAASLPGLIDAGDPTLAPEQLLDPTERARAIGPWTDVYGLAAIAHLAIAGRLPPPAHDWQAALARPSLAQYAGERWSPAMLVAIDRALSPDPAARPRSMDDFLAAMGLRERRARPRAATPTDAPTDAPAAEPAAAPAARTEAVAPAAPASESWRSIGAGWRWAVALLFCLLAALAIWSALHPGLPGAKPRAELQRPNEMPVSEAVRSKG
jgi:non-specific serine/threonine protein kinase